MDVTKENFEEVLPQVLDKIQTCKFVSFDLEMTGIMSSDRSKRNRKDDLPSDRYAKMVGPATTYSIVQFGLSTFHECPDGSFTASPYNFYLFPDFGDDIALSLSSIDFLRKNNLDFGKWISSGVTYTNKRGEENLRKQFSQEEPSNISSSDSAAKTPRRYITLSRQSDIDFMKQQFDQLDQFLESTSMTFEFERCNGYLRRYIYEQVEKTYDDSVALKKNENQQLCAFKIDKESKLEFEQKRKEENATKFRELIGFRQVYKALTEANKPVVGHNLLYDLMFVHRWLESPLPENYLEFKKELKSKFPVIFDTKYVDASGVLGQKHDETTLSQCYQRYNNNTEGGKSAKINVSSDCLFDPTEAAFHNAGYDAYCTGVVFANQINTFEAAFSSEHGSSFDENGISASNWNQPLSVLAFDSFCRSCSNHLFMMQSLYHMNLEATSDFEELLKYDGAIFRVTGFPRNLQTQDILDVCASAFDEMEDKSMPIDYAMVIWVDDFSFFLNLNLPSIKTETLEASILKRMAKEKWTAERYSDYLRGIAEQNQNMRDIGNASAPTTEITQGDSFFPTLKRWISDMFSFSSPSENIDGSLERDGSKPQKRRRVEVN